MSLSTRRLLAAIAAGGVLAAVGTAWAADAHASPETNYLDSLNAAGLTIYDTSAALAMGHQICAAFNTTTGDVVAQNLFANTTWADVPNLETANTIVVLAGLNLCPWHFHPERARGGQVVT
ncbi:DUF732 domain-containing protein [Mycobacterium sp. NPDC050041]|uniref:DUF732 domain-containing protein n=1 Tax=Mycobacterium sp. NPDC050041 TaxID=3364293 RepID=UPI003C2E9C98